MAAIAISTPLEKQTRNHQILIVHIMKTMTHLKKGISALLALALMLTFSSCYKDGICIRGNGQPEIEIRSVGNFDEVINNGSFEVRIVPATYYEVEVDAESNLLSYIRTSVSGQRLFIETDENRCINNSMSMIVTVYTPYVDGIELNGSGSVSADDLFLDELKLRLNGSGEITVDDIDVLQINAKISGSGRISLSGIAETTDFSITGSGNIEAFQLNQQRCFATVSGSGNMYVRVSSLLDAIISGSGNIYYRGNPDVVQQISGSGRVIKQ